MEELSKPIVDKEKRNKIGVKLPPVMRLSEWMEEFEWF